MYFLGIDIGTSFWKAVLYNEKGRAVAEDVRAALIHNGSKYDFYEPEELWQSVVDLIRSITAQVKNPQDIKGIGVAAMAEAGVVLDKNGNSLYPIIAWYDDCTMEQTGWWEKKAGKKAVYDITGLYIKHIYSANKLIWLKRNEPVIYNKMAKWLCIPDFIVYKLTGAYSMDYSIASRTMLLDIKKRQWSTRMLDFAEIEENVMPRLYPSGTGVGKVKKEVAELTGLKTDTVVVTGGHDHVCGALAAGVVKEGILLDSIGTAESLFTTINKPVLNEAVFKTGFSSGCHVYPGQYYVMGGIYTSGAVVDWVIRLFNDKAGLLKKDKLELYEKIINESYGLTAENENLFLFPYFRGSGPPDVNYSRKGIITGLMTNHTTKDILTAAINGLSCESRKTAEAMEKYTGKKMREFIVTGALTRLKAWMQVKANVLSREIELADTAEAGTLGAAMLAGLGTGLFKSADEVIKAMKPGNINVKPDFADAEKLNNYYKTYKKLSAQKDIKGRS